MGGGEETRLQEADERFRCALQAFRDLIARVEDEDERRHLEKQLSELALVDDVTGLHNRRSFLLLPNRA